MEVNAQTDIVITASLGQLQLFSLLVQEVLAAQQVLSFKPGFGRHGKFKNSKTQISHLNKSNVVFLSNYNALLYTRIVFTSFLDFFSSRAFSLKKENFWRQNNSSKHCASKRPLISASDFRSVTTANRDTIKLTENSNFEVSNNGESNNGDSSYGK